MSGERDTDTDAQARPNNHGPIGARLIAAREQRQLTAESVARQLKLDVSVIHALEHDDVRNLPAPIFVQGYLRSYARLLDLPEHELVNDYTSHSDVLPPLTVSRATSSKPFFGLPSMRLIRNIILVMLAAITLWLAFPYLQGLLEPDSRLADEPLPGHLEIPPAEK